MPAWPAGDELWLQAERERLSGAAAAALAAGRALEAEELQRCAAP